MIYTGWSVLPKTKSQDILNPYSCSDPNKMASQISTQLVADSSVLWSLPNEASHVFQKERFLVCIILLGVKIQDYVYLYIHGQMVS